MMPFANKRILITAGPTWVAIDKVRVISNIATGATGIMLAHRLAQQGNNVTLLLGPTGNCCIDKKIRLVTYRFFDELKERLLKEVRARKYDIIIHSAAVSDYRPQKEARHKIKSGIKKIGITLTPTKKLIDLIKQADKNVFLVGFKFEPETEKKALLKSAKSLIERSKAEVVVANTVLRNKYRAYLVDRFSSFGPFNSRQEMIEKLIALL